MRVAVQQRHRLYREGLAELLAAEDDLRVIGSVESQSELVALCDRIEPDAAVLEWDVSVEAPRHTVRQLRSRLPTLRIVVLRDRVEPVITSWSSPARATVIARGAGMAPILDAIRAPVPVADAIRRDEPEASEPRLTPRERAVLTLIGAGYTTGEIAIRLGISRKTVDNYKQRMFTKLAVQNQAHAVAVAIRQGMLVPLPFVDSSAS